MLEINSVSLVAVISIWLAKKHKEIAILASPIIYQLFFFMKKKLNLE
jgi:hypothetical protein